MTEDKNRCVITGLGTICAIGENVNECWNSILAGRGGIDHTQSVDTTDCYSDLSAEPQIEYDMDSPGSMDRVSFLCLRAAEEAMEDAGLRNFNGDAKTSVIMGSCVGGGRSIDHYYTMGKTTERVREMPISPIANHVAQTYGAGGVVTNIANACAAGTMSIGYACDLIRAGKADVVIAGGADTFSSVPYAGFLSLQAIAKEPCSPFNHSNGITLGEGAGVVIVESYEHAVQRGADIYCEVLGSSVSADAYHITAPRPDGQGQMYAINTAIEHSGLTVKDIDYINAHGTGTAKNDEAEFLSIHTLFDGKNDSLSVSSTKAMTGHCLGAAGAIEAVFSIKALTEGIIPPTIGYLQEDIQTLKENAGEINFCPNEVQTKDLRTVMSNSFAFGGTNASIIFSKHKGNVVSVPAKKDIVITGLGIVTPCGNTTDSYIQAWTKNSFPDGELESAVGPDDYKELGLKMSFYRKLDHFSQLQAVSGVSALKDAAFEANEENEFRSGIIVGTSEGALSSACDFQMLIAEKGNASGSAFKFPNTVYNAAGGYLSICSGLKGYNATVTNGPQSALQAMAYAINIIRNGWADSMLASGNDENSEIIKELYSYLMLDQKHAASGKNVFRLSDGSISIFMETREIAEARGAHIYCRVAGYGMAYAQGISDGGAEKALGEAMRSALDDAEMKPEEIDMIFGFRDGIPAVDFIEKSAAGDMFPGVPVISVNDNLGEGRAASAALSAAHAALLLNGDISSERPVRNVLVVSGAPGGSFAAVILSKCEEK